MSGLRDIDLFSYRHSLAYRIMGVLLIIGVILISLVVTVLYLNDTKSFEEQYILGQKFNDQSLNSSVQIVQQTLFAYDGVFDHQISVLMKRFLNGYNQTSGRVDLLDLDLIKKQYEESTGATIQLSLIDPSGIIRYSTIPTEIGYNYSNNSAVFQRLTTIRLNGSYLSEGVIRSADARELIKARYQATPDHQFIIRIVYSVRDSEELRQSSSYASIANNYAATVPGVISIFVFNKKSVLSPDPYAGLEQPDEYWYKYSPNPDRQKHLKKVFSSREWNYGTFIVSNDSISRRYLYVAPLNLNNGSSDPIGRVIEITYSTEELRKRQIFALWYYLFFAIIGIGIMGFVTFLVSRYITRPIDQMVADIEVIANGSYDHSIRSTQGFEFGRLEASVGKMVTRLKEDIITLRRTSEELDQELQHRLRVEDSLRNANQKLNLLGTITRHDILNQIAIITGAMELITDEPVPEGRIRNLYGMIGKATLNIQKQIRFTSVYEKMGGDDPVWQRISLLVSRSKEELSMPGVVVYDQTEEVEVLADAMLDRVIFNLLENSVRHGKTVTRIDLTFTSMGNNGLLVISDDGCGVPAEEKEKIFLRGYGLNTGLGLFLVREILAITGITIRENGTGCGTRFEIIIPEGYWRARSTCSPDQE
ncbi:MAG TPA: sensor histidine kinase [Methanospirillum sp.]|nr:sensor histidine kinase [Methanospirillum sp.]